VKNARICTQENESGDVLAIAPGGQRQQALFQARESADVGLATRADRGTKVSGSGSLLRRSDGVNSQSGAAEALSRSRGGPVSAAAGRATGRQSLEGGSGAFHEARPRFEWLRAAERGARGGYRRRVQARRRNLRSEAEAEQSAGAATPGTGRKAARRARDERPPSREARGRPIGCLDCKVRGVAAGQEVPAAFSCRSRAGSRGVRSVFARRRVAVGSQGQSHLTPHLLPRSRHCSNRFCGAGQKIIYMLRLRDDERCWKGPLALGPHRDYKAASVALPRNPVAPPS